MNKVLEEIKKTKTKLKTKLDTNVGNEIFSILKKNNRLYRKHLQ